MNILSIIIGVPLGLWMSDKSRKLPAIIEGIKVSHAAADKKRFGPERKLKSDWDARQARIEENTHNRVVEYMNRNNKGE